MCSGTPPRLISNGPNSIVPGISVFIGCFFCCGGGGSGGLFVCLGFWVLFDCLVLSFWDKF